MRKFLAVGTTALSFFISSGVMAGTDPNPPDYGLGKIPLEHVTTEDGFKYFSGNMSTGNNPAMFAGFKNGVWYLTVVGPGFYQEFVLKDIEKAIRAYKALLVVRGYDLPLN